MDWQPIKTAPKDGTSFLAAIEYRFGHSIENMRWYNGNLVFSRDHKLVQVWPTDWQPLPKPPVPQ